MRNPARAASLAAVVALAAILFASPALAHVKVSGTNARQGGYGVLTFSVPNESDSAAVVGLRVFLPQDTPIYVVDTAPNPGWTAILTEKPLPSPQTDNNGTVHNSFVSEVHWIPDNPQAAIGPKQFGQFSMYAGPLPNRNALPLPAEQTYSDGRIVNWNDDPFAGPPQPGHPAPVLKLGSGASDLDIFTTTETVQNNTPLWPAIVALVVAAVSLLIAGAAFILMRRKDKKKDENIVAPQG
ncbi:nuclear export factor GLE1 family protein [Mycobacterium europaeum]|uniref:Nuclear export factor GLE1 family protein n=1 Tax=Mycobacterium europaeum TaxID=761804 RepID=A0A0U1DIT1_9MYCO|nr:YcnI family protein [Mycobacterium europaeum]CQD17295.1 nuclear export factor GLE1 family protein [Mycobacterium europaeum]